MTTGELNPVDEPAVEEAQEVAPVVLVAGDEQCRSPGDESRDRCWVGGTSDADGP